MFLSIIGAVIIGVAVGYYFYRKSSDASTQEKPIEIPVETVEGSVAMKDVVAWFKLKHLDPKKHTPFLAQCKVEGQVEEKPFNKWVKPVKPVSKPKLLLIGAYNESADVLDPVLFIEADAIDASILDIMGAENLVVLS